MLPEGPLRRRPDCQRLPGYSLPVEGDFFHEFAVQCPLPPAQINRFLLERKIIGGYDLSHRIPNTMLLCVTEMNPAGGDRLASGGSRRGGEPGMNSLRAPDRRLADGPQRGGPLGYQDSAQ